MLVSVSLWHEALLIYLSHQQVTSLATLQEPDAQEEEFHCRYGCSGSAEPEQSLCWGRYSSFMSVGSGQAKNEVMMHL